MSAIAPSPLYSFPGWGGGMILSLLIIFQSQFAHILGAHSLVGFPTPIRSAAISRPPSGSHPPSSLVSSERAALRSNEEARGGRALHDEEESPPRPEDAEETPPPRPTCSGGGGGEGGPPSPPPPPEQVGRGVEEPRPDSPPILLIPNPITHHVVVGLPFCESRVASDAEDHDPADLVRGVPIGPFPRGDLWEPPQGVILHDRWRTTGEQEVTAGATVAHQEISGRRGPDDPAATVNDVRFFTRPVIAWADDRPDDRPPPEPDTTDLHPLPTDRPKWCLCGTSGPFLSSAKRNRRCWRKLLLAGPCFIVTIAAILKYQNLLFGWVGDDRSSSPGASSGADMVVGGKTGGLSSSNESILAATTSLRNNLPTNVPTNVQTNVPTIVPTNLPTTPDEDFRPALQTRTPRMPSSSTTRSSTSTSTWREARFYALSELPLGRWVASSSSKPTSESDDAPFVEAAGRGTDVVIPQLGVAWHYSTATRSWVWGQRTLTNIVLNKLALLPKPSLKASRRRILLTRSRVEGFTHPDSKDSFSETFGVFDKPVSRITLFERDWGAGQNVHGLRIDRASAGHGGRETGVCHGLCTLSKSALSAEEKAHTSGQGVRAVSLELEAGEKVERVWGEVGRQDSHEKWVKLLGVETNLRRKIEAGHSTAYGTWRNSVKKFSFDSRPGKIVGFEGGCGGHLHRFGVVWHPWAAAYTVPGVAAMLEGSSSGSRPSSSCPKSWWEHGAKSVGDQLALQRELRRMVFGYSASAIQANEKRCMLFAAGRAGVESRTVLKRWLALASGNKKHSGPAAPIGAVFSAAWADQVKYGPWAGFEVVVVVV